MLIAGSCPHCGKPLVIKVELEQIAIPKIQTQRDLDIAKQIIDPKPGMIDRYESFIAPQQRRRQRPKPIKRGQGGIVARFPKTVNIGLESDPNPDQTMKEYNEKRQQNQKRLNE